MKSFIAITKRIKLLLVMLVAGFQLSAQQTYTFTNSGAMGRSGPTSVQTNTTYASTNLAGLVTTSAGIQYFLVPASGLYRIEAFGASGGNANFPLGGLGARMAGEFTLSAGSIIKILVGQRGVDGIPVYSNTPQQAGGTGGGGSFVSSLSNVPLIVAGGGGGASNSGAGGGIDATGQGAVTTTNGVGGGGSANSGGTGGSGGVSCPATGWHGGTGGGGFSGNGVNNSMGNPLFGDPNTPGLSFVNGGSGGTGSSLGRDGGFGGGGSSGYTGAGGGGYSGGGAGLNSPMANSLAGGGGGSYNAGTNQNNSPAVNSGHGKVIITELCVINLLSSADHPLKPVICSGNSVSLTTSASSYTWSNGNTTNPVWVVSPTITTSYSVTGAGNSCLYEAAITVSVESSVPALTVSGTSYSICYGNSVTLTGSGATTYTWSGGITNDVAFTPSQTASYILTGENSCGTTTAVTSITVTPLPILTFATPSVACAGETTTLTSITAATNYSWMPINITTTLTSLTITPTVSTVYTVMATDGICIGQATLGLQVNPIPTVITSVGTASICEGDNISVSVSGGLTYTWSAANLSGSLVTLSPSVTTVYSVSGDNVFGCTGTDYVAVFIKPSPQINATATRTLICPNETSTLVATGASTYMWSSGHATYSAIVTPPAASIYTVTATQLNGCQRTKTVAVNVFQPAVSISPSATAICKGTILTLVAGTASTYSWNNIPGSSFNPVSPLQDTQYRLTVSSASAGITCTASAIATVSVNDNPVVSIIPTKTMLCKDDAPAILNANGALNYSWATVPPVTTQSIVSGPQTAIYSVTGTDINQCSATATVSILVNICSGITEEQNTAFAGLIIYPNPSSGNVDLRFISTGSTASIVIMDITGKMIHHEDISTVKGENIKSLQLPVIKGFYMIRLIAGNNSELRKVVVE